MFLAPNCIRATTALAMGVLWACSAMAVATAAPLIDGSHQAAAERHPAPVLASNERWVSPAELYDVAERALAESLRGRAQRLQFSMPGQGISGVVVAAERAELIARGVGSAPLAPRMTVWVDVKQAGQVKRTLLVPVQVSAYDKGWVAVRDLPAGTRLSTGILREEEVDVASGRQAAWRGDPEGQVLRRPVLANQYLRATQVSAPRAVARGETVQMVHRVGAVEIQAVANALQDGELGQHIQVRVDAAQTAVLARVVAAGQVELVK